MKRRSAAPGGPRRHVTLAMVLAGLAGFFGLVADLSPLLVAMGPPVGLVLLSLWLLLTSR